MALKKSNVRLIFLSAFYLFFLLVGAAIFSAIEGPIEMKRLRDLVGIRQKFLQNRQDCLNGTLYYFASYHMEMRMLYVHL